jgi:hypothetical protein
VFANSREAGMIPVPSGGQRLARDHESLALGVPRAVPGAIYALAVSGGVSLAPREGSAIRFGRNRPDVEICVGEDDLRVSRQHGRLTRSEGHWWVHNTGQLPIRLPSTQWLSSQEEPVPLAEGYTPLFIRGSRNREHLLELFVAGPGGEHPVARPGDVTQPPRRWRLTEDERLVLVVLGQRYLLHEPNPQPLARQQVADRVGELRSDALWNVKRVERTIAEVRFRLSSGGVHGLVREEVGEPVGNSLNDNLLRELVGSTTLVPPDLALLDDF